MQTILKNNNYWYHIFFLYSFLLSLILIGQIIQNIKFHIIISIKGTSHYFLKAEIFKENLESNQTLDSGEHQASIFYPISLGFFYNFIDLKIFFEKKINQK